jgi:nucleoid-associated protein YgaU
VVVVEEVAEPEVVVVEEVAEPEVVVVEEPAEPLVESSLANIPRNYTKFIATEVVGKDSRLAWISYKYYGVKDFWVYIYEANLDQVSSPNYVKPGQKIRIPALDSKYTDLNDPEVQKLLLYLSQEYTKH